MEIITITTYLFFTTAGRSYKYQTRAEILSCTPYYDTPGDSSCSGSSTEGEEKRNEGREEEESRASGSSGAEWSGASADGWEGS